MKRHRTQLTAEDLQAFWFVRKRSPRNLNGEDFLHAYIVPYFLADATDAEIMLDLVQRWQCARLLQAQPLYDWQPGEGISNE